MNWPGSVPLVVDTSAFARARRVPDGWREAVALGRLATCESVRLEMIYSAQNAADAQRLSAELDELRDLAITRGTLISARRAMLHLAERGSDGYHRVPPTDAIIAACAGEHGCGVLHYDAHYDRLAEVLDFPSIWLVPRGTADA